MFQIKNYKCMVASNSMMFLPRLKVKLYVYIKRQTVKNCGILYGIEWSFSRPRRFSPRRNSSALLVHTG